MFVFLLRRPLFWKKRAAMPAQKFDPLAEIGFRALEVLTKTADAEIGCGIAVAELQIGADIVAVQFPAAAGTPGHQQSIRLTR